MGLGLDKQQIYTSNLSSGIIKIGTDSDNPVTNITVNDNITAVGTRISATEVNFQVTNHAQYGTATGKYIKTTLYTPAAYNITGVILSLPDANNIRVTPLSDPITDDTITGVIDFGSINIVFPAQYRIVDRVNDSNGTPANNQFSKSRSRILNWVATANLDHSTLPDGNSVIIVDDTEIISVIQLVSGEALLPVFSDSEPDINSHVQIGNITKDGGSIFPDTNESRVSTNNNTHNKIRNIARSTGTINSLDNPVIISPITTTIGVSNNAGMSFSSSDAGYIQSKGFNPNQFQIGSASPATIITLNRAGNGAVSNISSSLNVNQYESSPGTFSAKGASKASNNFIIAFGIALIELLGQTTYSGGTRLDDASTANEPVDNPKLSTFGILAGQISIENAATDLSLTAEAIFADLKQFR